MFRSVTETLLLRREISWRLDAASASDGFRVRSWMTPSRLSYTGTMQRTMERASRWCSSCFSAILVRSPRCWPILIGKIDAFRRWSTFMYLCLFTVVKSGRFPRKMEKKTIIQLPQLPQKYWSMRPSRLVISWVSYIARLRLSPATGASVPTKRRPSFPAP